MSTPWRSIHKDRQSTDPAYAVQTIDDGNLTLPALREMFPTATADSMNFVLFSTSGTHGTYDTIEDVEEEVKTNGFTFDGLTFVVVQPRLAGIRYGRVYPQTPEDFDFLRMLRTTSWAAVSKIGAPSE